MLEGSELAAIIDVGDSGDEVLIVVTQCPAHVMWVRPY